jgi:hypothetical protein
MSKMNKVLFFLSFFGVCGIGFSQQTDSIPDTQIEPPELVAEAVHDIK